MKTYKINVITKNLLGAFFILLISNVLVSANDFATASGKLTRDQSLAIAANGLSTRLRSDLVLKNVSVKFEKAEEYYVSKTQIGIRGEGKCEFSGEANPLPINFDVRIDVNRQSVADVKYVFLDGDDANGEPVMAAAEELATKQLLEKIKADYKTENIVIAVDYVNDSALADGANSFSGAGEVRIGDLAWKKIKFEIVARGDDAKTAEVKYQIQ